MSRILVKSKNGPLYMVRSKKSIVLEECSCVKCRLGWNLFRSSRNHVSSAVDLVQIMNMSSMYILTRSGWMGCVSKNSFKMMDINILAIVGEKGAPIAVPLIC